MTKGNHYPRFRAPVENGQLVCHPPWNTLSSWVSESDTLSQFKNVKFFGQNVSQISVEARHDVLSAAKSYTSQYTDSISTFPVDGPLFITGHQPELFHPGVWYKNFFAGRLAQSFGGTAINLIINSDLCRNPSIRVPTGSVDDPTVVNVPFDQVFDQVPYEERQVRDPSLWKTFGKRAGDSIAALVKAPLVREWWPNVVSSGRETNLGSAISQARHQLELSWRSHSWELPQSLLCQIEAFRIFALHLFVYADTFQSSYNSALADYRELHQLRNQAQPVPNLGTEGEWIESPFWLWNSASPVRRPLFVRSSSGECQLTDRHSFVDSLPIQQDSEFGLAISKLADWEARGIKLRTRALTTTLFVRLLLADVFIHGIGGAKYDQVTDSLCRKFFGVSLPHYATVSGTLHLPIKEKHQTITSENELGHKLRELTYHPERQLENMRLGPGDNTRIQRLLDTKAKWIQTPKTRENASLRHREITKVNEQLQIWLSDQRQHLEQELSRSVQQAQISQILQSREYSYCLFPSETLKDFLVK